MRRANQYTHTDSGLTVDVDGHMVEFTRKGTKLSIRDLDGTVLSVDDGTVLTELEAGRIANSIVAEKKRRGLIDRDSDSE